MKKADFIIIGVLLSVSFITLACFIFFGKRGAYVTVTCDGEKYGTYNLSKDRVVEIKNGDFINVLQIKDGQASVIEANCPNKDCMHFKAIDKSGETICCLPHRVTIMVESKEEPEIDAQTY